MAWGVIYIFTQDAVWRVSAKPVLCDGQRAISVPFISPVCYGPGQIRYEGTIKRKHSCWILCCLLLMSVCEHTSTHLLLLQNKTDTSQTSGFFCFLCDRITLLIKVLKPFLDTQFILMKVICIVKLTK